MKIVLSIPIILLSTYAADFNIGGHHVRPGTREDFDLPIPAAADPATVIPITVFHGIKPGPVLAISAGVHGAEYAPIIAVQRLLPLLDARQLHGTLVVVRIAHVSAFQTATVFYNPYDRKNLARVFPGKPDGTQSERIAHALTQEIVRRVDALIDLHGGDATESLHPFVGVFGGKLAQQQYEMSRRIGLALRFKTIVKYAMDTPEQVNGRGRSPNRQAVADGKPSVLVEIGDRGHRDESTVQPITDGLLNVLRELKMIAGKPQPAPRDFQWIERTVSVTSPVTGIFYPLTEAGKYIRKGEKAGYVTNYLGETIAELLAPEEGLVLYMPQAPPLNEGPSSPLTIGIPSSLAN